MTDRWQYRVIDQGGEILAEADSLSGTYPESDRHGATVQKRRADGSWTTMTTEEVISE